MNLENIKSIILTILVITSVFFTWSLWTYQPNYSKMDPSKTVEEIAVGDKKDLKKIVKPDRLLYHQKGSHFGTSDAVEIDKVIKELSKWSIYELKYVSLEINEFTSFIHKEGNAEIIFPDSIPIELYKNVLEIKDNENINFNFDRIVIQTEGQLKEDGVLYFVSYEDQRILKGRVTSSFVINFKEKYFRMASLLPNFQPLFSFQVTDQRTLFLPEGATSLYRYEYILDSLPLEKFKNALFRNPSLVQKNFSVTGEEYTDSSNLMSVDFENRTISFVNPAEKNEYTISSNNLLQKSIEFVNQHGGWTDNYRYVGINELNQQVAFRIYDPVGYPVFSREGISDIVLTWGETEINKYLRNNFSLDLQTEKTDVALWSGHKVLDYLLKQEDFNKDYLQDIVLGYTMIKDSQDPLIYLEPTWYYQYNNHWWPIVQDDREGMNYGLE
ncbi:two-component system activity regulator YycH [Cytobacillus spongiae]|uniref:YycH family regulatory protein n=1 Tax=Cytobacillus spongiae TaxID=2901381 RepID=UPI001F30DF5C|nr:two-component system activity regulator YycH [Cytobacillus spongiae]UII55933.1 two-component system activity regulator YycH [Cytobacillus spongiae]